MCHTSFYENENQSGKVIHLLRHTIAALLLLVLAQYNSAAEQKDTVNSSGAAIYIERCALCHGNYGYGDGYIPLSLQQYPNTSLFEPKYGHELKQIVDAIRWGGSKGNMSPLSPPWKGELSDQEIQAVSQFIIKIRNNSESVRDDIDIASKNLPSSARTGRQIYLTRCKICHGENGEGDGVLSGKVINNPPPFDLTQSRQDAAYLKQIIMDGGGKLGRSSKMPAWKYELLSHEVESLVIYIRSIRQ
ncbi:c-type cytochrome [Pseudoteredinibacter isoporae]|uniref:Cytochrome c oxidase cbb3-type subunit 3 n=1 Tax=Pseudoteredinibacter isoporae TaxID=570281 RepID=A0A7X0MVY8_9GAMM|nr:c-type cytochrome [Pseudoteredinibacter isoporae]MBB6520339.1 cytochrome c oxidase cbb3-type subunit 3 [Pseudoteredinibacter isoporae]NHO85910.1 c-type cytochrome [Pseudoteredinibacter isoporae]NIB25638.1 c-type cytochrome [Pseudoteredinibacter isoporae]